MNQDFSSFEQGIDSVYRQLPGMPRDRVVLNRLFFFMFKELDEVYNRKLAEFDLNSTTFLALVMILSSDGHRLNPCDLSHALIASRTNVTRLADELVGAGWVDRRPSTEDRRRVELSLTEAGRKLLFRALPAVWKLVDQQWSGFSAAEIVEFDRLLRKMLAGVTRLKEAS